MDAPDLNHYIQQIEILSQRFEELQSTVSLLERHMPTANAMAAINGNRAEHILAKDISSHNALSKYHNKKIVSLVVVKGGKKTDVKGICEDDDTSKYQVKNSDSPGGSYHVNRKPLEKFTADPGLRQTLNTFLLRKEGEKNDIKRELSQHILRRSLLGDVPEFHPTHMIHTVTNSGILEKLFICPMDKLLDYLCKHAHEKAIFKTSLRAGEETRSIELTPGITLKRRGTEYDKKGNIKASSDDIQTKLNLSKALLDALFSELPLPKI